jgi:hypothetical protein
VGIVALVMETTRMRREALDAWEQRCEELRADGHHPDDIFNIIDAETAEAAAARGEMGNAHDPIPASLPLGPPLVAAPAPTAVPQGPVPDPAAAEQLRATITAEVYTTLAAGILPMAADAMATVRVEALEAGRRVGGETTRLKEQERAQRVLEAAELRRAEAEEEESLATFRARLAVTRLVGGVEPAN